VRLGERAPVPNRDIEAPRLRLGPEEPTFRPDFIRPRDELRGGTFDGDQVRQRHDRLFDQPAPGARLSIPFSY
jgi:hypothetical protein